MEEHTIKESTFVPHSYEDELKSIQEMAEAKNDETVVLQNDTGKKPTNADDQSSGDDV